MTRIQDHQHEPFSDPGMDWARLGVGGDGQPIHMPIPCNEKGQGPVIDVEARTWHCWCGSLDCLLDKALREAWRSGVRIITDGHY